MTKADFYIDTKKGLKWLGSTDHDGYFLDEEMDIDEISSADKRNNRENWIKYQLRNCTDAEQYKDLVEQYIIQDGRGSQTNKEPWPWHWKTSKLTDYVYIFKDGVIYKSYKHIGDYDDHKTPMLCAPLKTRLCSKSGLTEYKPKKDLIVEFYLPKMA